MRCAPRCGAARSPPSLSFSLPCHPRPRNSGCARNGTCARSCRSARLFGKDRGTATTGFGSPTCRPIISEHATAYLAAGLFERHDRSRFEVIGVSYGPDDHSPMRQRLMRAFDRFVDVRSRGDEETARLLREMEVDIAIDLKGYTTGARPEILSYRPAPVQVSYLGFPGTMAAPFIDYIVADRCVLPAEDRLSLHRAGGVSARLLSGERCGTRDRRADAEPRRGRIAARRVRVLLLQQQLQDHAAGV